MSRGPAKSLARVLPHSRIATHPTFVREAARSDAVVSSPVVTGQLPDRPRIDHRTRGRTVGNPMSPRGRDHGGPRGGGCAAYAPMSHTMAKWLTAEHVGSRIGATTEEDDCSNGGGDAASRHQRQPGRRDRYDEDGQGDDDHPAVDDVEGIGHADETLISAALTTTPAVAAPRTAARRGSPAPPGERGHTGVYRCRR
jgi:hypothetical protein